MRFHKSTYLLASLTLLSTTTIVNAAPTPGIAPSRESQEGGSKDTLKASNTFTRNDDIEAQWGQAKPNPNNDVIIDILNDDKEFFDSRSRSRERKPSPAKASLSLEEAKENTRSFVSKERKPAPQRASLSSAWEEAEKAKPDHVVIDILPDDRVGQKDPFHVEKKQQKGSNSRNILEDEDMDEEDENWLARDGIEIMKPSDKDKIDRKRLAIDDMV